MKTLVMLKMIVRSWWRNKVFFFISVMSLAVGLACTNLLFTFFVHDYNIEHDNPNKERIYWMQQDNPMKEGERVPFVSSHIPSLLHGQFAEVEACTQIGNVIPEYCKYNEVLHSGVTMIQADSLLPYFFPQEIIIGSLKQVLQQPGKVAISETFARHLFGDDNPLGKVLETKTEWEEAKQYEVAAVIRTYSQGLLRFDLLTGMDSDFYGGTTFLLLSSDANPAALEQKIKEHKIPTMMADDVSQYYILSLPELYLFHPNSNKMAPPDYINQSNIQLLYISLIAALLVLLIACCNYTNMSLSRVLQQLKMMHVEKLMGSRPGEIRRQLFLDAFLTVFLSFLLSLLLINDVLRLFNDLLGARLQMDFFFTMQMLPVLLVLVLIMAVLPAWYISRKLSRRSYSEYKMLYGGRRKQQLVALLVVVQFVISIGLLFATTVADGQIELTRQKAARYENLISIGGPIAPLAIPMKDELLKYPDRGIESASVGLVNILHAMLRELPVKQPDGTELKSTLLMVANDEDFFHTFRLESVFGEETTTYSHPVWVNESYVKTLVPSGINPIGHRVDEFDPLAGDTLSVIAGVVRDFPINSLEEQVNPFMLNLVPISYLSNARMLTIRLDAEKREEALRFIEQTWNRLNEGVPFQYTDMHELFMERNSKVIDLCRMLVAYSVIGLLLTCFGLFGISWYAIRQRMREIAIRKIHGAHPWHIIWLLNRPFLLQTLLAYVMAIPFTYWLLLPWREQFAYRAPLTAACFLLPLLVVWLITVITVCVQGWLLNRSNPAEVIKRE